MSTFTKTVIVDADGGGNYNNIKDAAAALASTGGSIIVEQGTYTIDSIDDIIAVSSNTTISGQGNVIILVIGAFTAFRNTAYQSGSNTRINISGFKIVVDMTPDTYTVANDAPAPIYMKNVENCIFDNITITVGIAGDTKKTQTGCANNGIYLHNAVNCTVSRCIIDSFQSGIHLIAAYNNAINSNVVTGCYTNCYLNTSDYNVISGNSLREAYIHPNLLVETSKGTVISGNQADDSTGYWDSQEQQLHVSNGIYLAYTNCCPVIGNVASNNGRNGIQIHYENTSTPDCFYPIVGNICNENGKTIEGHSVSSDGIFLQGCTVCNAISGNVCVNNSANGIQLTNDPDVQQHAENNLLVGNICIVHATPGSDKAIKAEDPNNIIADYKAGSL